MNGYFFGDQHLKITEVQANMSMMMDTSALDLEDESSNYITSAHTRAMLIQKLAQSEGKQKHFFKLPMKGSYELILGMGYREGGLIENELLETGRNDVSSEPTTTLILSNMFNYTEIELASDPRFFNEIKDDVKNECEKHGKVENVLVESSGDGIIWVKYCDLKDAIKAKKQLENSHFKARQIISSFGKEESYRKRALMLK